MVLVSKASEDEMVTVLDRVTLPETDNEMLRDGEDEAAGVETETETGAADEDAGIEDGELAVGV
jgi:hypothetical protein